MLPRSLVIAANSGCTTSTATTRSDTSTVIGVNVGGERKGFHAAALRGVRAVRRGADDGRFRSESRLRPPLAGSTKRGALASRSTRPDGIVGTQATRDGRGVDVYRA